MAKKTRIKSCAGCRALFKSTNNGAAFVWCYLNKTMVISQSGVLDKRLDFIVYRKPIENCKVKTNKQVADSFLNKK